MNLSDITKFQDNQNRRKIEEHFLLTMAFSTGGKRIFSFQNPNYDWRPELTID